MARKNRVCWNPAIHEPILRRLHADNKTDKEIAAATGHAEETVRVYRNELGLPSNAEIVDAKPKLVVERPLTARTKENPGWDFTRDNLALPKDI